MQDSFTVDGLKAQAKALRDQFIEHGAEISHSESLEAISKIHGLKDWNTARAIASSKIEDYDDRAKVYVSELDIETFGWQQFGQIFRVGGHSSCVLQIVPTIAPFFEPKAVRMVGCDWKATSKSRRFIVKAVRVGGSPQLASNYVGEGDAEGPGLISDIFSFKDPLMVRWSVFSGPWFGRALEIHVQNPNDADILVSVSLWGNPVAELDDYLE